MNDLFVGTWTLNREQSAFDPNHRPLNGIMRWERGENGEYVLNAEGTNEKGEPCVERPQRFMPDGQPRPIPEFPGLSAVTTQPAPNVIQGEVRREDGSVVGQGKYEVNEDGRSMIATTAGFDSQLRRFEQRTFWDRQP